MAFIWHFERDGAWIAFDSGNAKTMSFLEGRYAEYREREGGGPPRRTLTLKNGAWKLDFSRMTVKLPGAGGTICKMRRSSNEVAMGAAAAESAVPPKTTSVPSIPTSAQPTTTSEPPAPAGSSAHAASNNGVPGAPGDPFRALSVHYLSTPLVKELERCGLTLVSTIRDMEPVLIRVAGADALCPRDGRRGAAFVDVVTGEENVGRATHMLSYTWGYAIGTVIESLCAWCEREQHDPRQTRAWMCCFCINQHRVVEAQAAGTTVPFEEFRHEFESRVRGIGKVLSLFGTWKLATYVTRVWCVFELYSAMELQARDPASYTLEMLMSPREGELFRQNLFEGSGLEEVWKALDQVRVEKADSYVKSDRDRILALVKEGPGYGRLNLEIVGHLHAWFAANSEGYLRQQLAVGGEGGTHDCMSAARACVRVGEMLEKVCKHESALELLQRGRKIFEAEAALETEEGANLLRVQGVVLRRLGRLQRGLEMFRRSAEIHKALGTDASTEYATLLQDMGRVHGDMADLDAEFKCHEQALKIREEEGTLKTPEGATLLRSLGMVHFQRYEYRAALDFFHQSKIMHEETSSLTTPEGAAALQSIGDVLSSMHPPQVRHALTVHENAFAISEQLGISRTPRAVVQLRRMEHLSKQLGLKHKALELMDRVKAILFAGTKPKSVLGIGHKVHQQTAAATQVAPVKMASDAKAPVSAKPVAAAPAPLADKTKPPSDTPPLAEASAAPPAVIDSSWGIYFEVVNDAGFADPEGRGFPHCLCSFETKATVGVLPGHLKISRGSKETLTVEGRDWTLDADAFRQTPVLVELQRTMSDGVITGYLSPLHEVNLTDDAKERAGIPPNAKYFMYSYPAKLWVAGSVARAPRSTDPDLAFLRNGGYVYLDESKTDIVRINAVLPSTDGGLRFGPPLKWETDWTQRLINAGRFRPITIDEISRSGATHFCWIRPNEVMWFDGSGGTPICPHGGFAYICRPTAAKGAAGSQASGARGVKRHSSDVDHRKRRL